MERIEATSAPSDANVEAAAGDKPAGNGAAVGIGGRRRCVFISGVSLYMICLVAALGVSLFNPLFMVVPLGILVLGIIACCFMVRNESRDRWCRTCQKDIPEEEWKSHVTEHLRREKEALAALPTNGDVRCPLCNELLKLQPETRSWAGNRFKCQAGNPPCPEISSSYESTPVTFHNNGRNRFSCVGCRFDMCYDCLNRRVQGAAKRARQEQQQQQQQQQDDVYKITSAPADEPPPPPYEQVLSMDEKTA